MNETLLSHIQVLHYWPLKKVKPFMGHLHKHSLCFDIILTAATTESVYPQPLAQISTETCQRYIA